MTVSVLTRNSAPSLPKRMASRPATRASFGLYSTWTGPGIYREDLFVRPVFRGHGIGPALLGQVALIARPAGCHTIRLDVLVSNETAFKFHQSLGGAYLENGEMS